MKIKLLTAIKYIVSIGLIILILIKADLSNATIAFRSINFSSFIYGMIVLNISMLIRSFKWQKLLLIHNPNVSLMTILNVNYMSSFFNNFFLGTIGGDIFRSVKVTGYMDTAGEGASSVVMDRATGFLASVFLVIVIGFYLYLNMDTLVSVNQIWFFTGIGVWYSGGEARPPAERGVRQVSGEKLGGCRKEHAADYREGDRPCQALFLTSRPF